jgi:hypothetical protein
MINKSSIVDLKEPRKSVNRGGPRYSIKKYDNGGAMKRGTPTHLSISGGSGTFPGHDAVKAQLTEAHDGPYDSIHFHLHKQLNGFYALPTST